ALGGAGAVAGGRAANRSAPPISWLGPAFVPDLEQRLADGVANEQIGLVAVLRNASDTVGAVLRESSLNPAAPPLHAVTELPPESQPSLPGLNGDGRATGSAPPPVETLSYSALASYEECGYRFYLERVLRLPPDQ